MAVYNHLRHRVHPERARSIIQSCVDVELDFVSAILPDGGLPGLHRLSMRRHVMSIGDFMCRAFDVEPLYNISSPLNYMLMQHIPGRINFFEKRPSEYQKAICAGTFTIHDAF